MPEKNSNQPGHLDEVRDVHPILRANPFIIEEGLKLVRGEKYLSSEELKRIDLLFEDKEKTPTFVEVKWSDVSENQMMEYRRLIDQYHQKSRLIWAVPQDLIQKASVSSKYGIEVKPLDRGKIIQIKDLQNKADEHLRQIILLLSSPFKIVLHGESVPFEDPFVACYFNGIAITERGRKEVGMRRQGTGRLLDLVKNLIKGYMAGFHKEKILLLIWELFRTPYLYKSGKFWKIADGGFIEHIKERQLYLSKHKKFAPILSGHAQITLTFFCLP